MQKPGERHFVTELKMLFEFRLVENKVRSPPGKQP